jgi:dienelactone hydrolase
MASELVAWAPDVDDVPATVVVGRPGWVRTMERLAPLGARLFGRRHFRAGVDRAACRAVHGAAARGSLFAFAPPPHFVRVIAGRGRRPVDLYRGRAPLVSGLAASGETRLRHHRGGGTRGALVVVNRGTGLLADVVARRLASALVAIGFDVAIPIAAVGADDDEQDWARTVGSALATIVRRVHDGAAVEAWGRALGYGTVLATGVGIGGTVTALLAATTSRFDGCVPILAGTHPGRLWLPPRALARAADHEALARDDVRQVRTWLRLFDPIAPGRLPAPRQRAGVAVVGFRYDRHVPPADVQALADHWKVRAVWLERCHVEVPLAIGALATVVAHAARSAGSNG